MEIIESSERTARNKHRCSWCGGIIEIGEKYNWSKNKDSGGNLYEWKNHVHCGIIASVYDFYDYGDEGLSEDEFCEALNDIFWEKFTSAEKAKLLYDKMKGEQLKEFK